MLVHLKDLEKENKFYFIHTSSLFPYLCAFSSRKEGKKRKNNIIRIINME